MDRIRARVSSSVAARACEAIVMSHESIVSFATEAIPQYARGTSDPEVFWVNPTGLSRDPGPRPSSSRKPRITATSVYKLYKQNCVCPMYNQAGHYYLEDKNLCIRIQPSCAAHDMGLTILGLQNHFVQKTFACISIVRLSQHSQHVLQRPRATLTIPCCE